VTHAVYISLNAESLGPYNVTLDAQGKIVQRDRLRAAGGTMRIAPPPHPNAPGRGRRGGNGGGRRAQSARPPPFSGSATSFKPDDWNTVEIFLDANIARVFLNNGAEIAGATDDTSGKYGPIALHIEGSGEVHFKDLAWRDLGQRANPPERVSSRFRVQRLN